MLSFFVTKSSDGESWILQPGGYLVFIALFLILIVIASLFRKKKSNHFETKPMVFSAVSIALATVTSMITILKMPYGGSVTLLSMMFITLVGYWYGLSIGLTTAVAYGILQLILDPYILSKLTLFMLGLIRLLLPKALLPATTALGTIAPDGREQGILAGANVVMPNLSPASVREKYLLYDNKLCTGSEAAESLEDLRQRMKRIGYRVAVSRGDSLNM